jgi:hypothetical protein
MGAAYFTPVAATVPIRARPLFSSGKVVVSSRRRSLHRRIFVTLAAVARTASLRTAVASAGYVVKLGVGEFPEVFVFHVSPPRQTLLQLLNQLPRFPFLISSDRGFAGQQFAGSNNRAAG